MKDTKPFGFYGNNFKIKKKQNEIKKNHIRFSDFDISEACVFFGKIMYWSLYDGNDKIKIVEKIKSFDEIFQVKEIRNKFVYADMWGTRCGPCLNEFQYKGPISREFENNGNLEFLYLAVPYRIDTSGVMYLSEKARWKSFIHKYNLEGTHVFLDYPVFEEVWNKLEGETDNGRTGSKYGIPRYFIIGNNGEILESKAHRPSNKDSLINQINSYLGIGSNSLN